MGSIRQRLNKRVSDAVRSSKIFEPFLIARRQRLVNQARKEMEGKTFTYGNISLPYFYHVYNSTYGSERAIEISIGKHFIETHDDVLEIGNVLSHYIPVSHPIVDKYERAPGVRNEDVVDIKDRHRNIISISTLEHVGWDEDGKDHTKFLMALNNLKSLVDGGTLLFTVPWGYNPSVDEFIKSFPGKMTLYYRDGREWKAGNLEDIKDKTVGSKYPNANAVAVIEIQAPAT
jgi:hypothetical protein